MDSHLFGNYNQMFLTFPGRQFYLYCSQRVSEVVFFTEHASNSFAPTTQQNNDRMYA